MNKKIIAMTIATMLIFLGTAAVSGSKMSITRTIDNNPVLADQEISLGSATIYGDGIEGHTNVDAVASKELTIKITSDPETVDLKISYSIQCDGPLDQGRVYLFVQLNSVDQGNESVEVAETESGFLTFDNVELSNGDVLTYEIGVLYANFDPIFTDADIDIGAAVTIKSRSIQSRFFDSPLFQLLQKIPIFLKLFA